MTLEKVGQISKYVSYLCLILYVTVLAEVLGPVFVVVLWVVVVYTKVAFPCYANCYIMCGDPITSLRRFVLGSETVWFTANCCQ